MTKLITSDGKFINVGGASLTLPTVDKRHIFKIYGSSFNIELGDGEITYNTVNFDFQIDWGDDTIENYSGTGLSIGIIEHTYSSTNEYTIIISGYCPAHIIPTASKPKITEILNLGDTGRETWRLSFLSCSNLTSVVGKSYKNNVTSFERTFEGCSSLTNVDLNGYSIKNVNNLSAIFRECSSLESINLSRWKNNNITSLFGVFSGCTSLTNISGLQNWNTSNVTSMIQTFNDCYVLSDSVLNSISNWDISNVSSFAGMFQDCRAIESVDFISNWYLNPLLPSIGISSMFFGCESLTSIDLSHWNTSNVTLMNRMFANCPSLNSVNTTGWDTSNVTTMQLMFFGDTNLKIDVSHFNMESVANVDRMFGNCNINEIGTTTNYDNLLVSWAAQDLVNGLDFENDFSQYSSVGEAAKTDIVTNDLWTITDGGLAT